MFSRFTPVEIPESKQKIDSDAVILTMGSCFSDNIGKRLVNLKFDCLANPLGVMYNPVSIQQTFQYLNGILLNESLFGQREDVHFHYDAHSEFSALDKNVLQENLKRRIQQGQEHFRTANWVFITLGTSFYHQLIEAKQIVANCHKKQSHLFEKGMLSVNTTIEVLTDVFTMFSDATQIILTVSPIRHTKEGIVENQRSKARLLVACQSLEEAFEHVHYFPSYELMMDELRDYHYYERDRIHPSQEAIDIIWDRFTKTFFTDKALQKAKAVDKINKAIAHKPFLPKSTSHQKFLQSLLQKIETCSRMYAIDFREEITQLERQLI